MNHANLLAVFAHPDDETFRCGGALARLVRLGVRVHLLCATRGEAGIAGMDPEQTGRLREAELLCACQALGIEPPRFLDYQDGKLAQAAEAQAVAQVTATVRELRPQVLLTWAPDGVSGHPDHVAVSRWASQAFEQAVEPDTDPAYATREFSPHAVAALYHIVVPQSLAQALGMSHLHATPDDKVTLAVDISDVWEAKMGAIRCHASQASATPILSAPEEKQRLFLGTEYFRLAASRPNAGNEPQEDFLKSLGRSKL